MFCFNPAGLDQYAVTEGDALRPYTFDHWNLDSTNDEDNVLIQPDMKQNIPALHLHEHGRKQWFNQEAYRNVDARRPLR